MMGDRKIYKKTGDMLSSLSCRSCQDNWWLLLIITCVLSVFIWRCWFMYQKVQIPYLQVKVESSAIGQIQLYYDQGYGFNEHDSVVKGLEKSRQKLWGLLPWQAKWFGDDDLHYYFQLPLSSLHAIRIQVPGSGSKVDNLAVVNGLGDLIEEIDKRNVLSVEDHDLSAQGGEAVLQHDIVFSQRLKLEQLQYFQLERFSKRIVAELIILLVVMALFIKIKSVGESLPFVRTIWSNLCSSSIQNRLIFVLFTIIFLWFFRPLNEQYFPMLFQKTFYLIFVILAIRSFLNRDWKKESLAILYIVFFYLLLCVVSVAMHYFALESLGSENYISYYKSNFHATLFDSYEWVKRLTSEGVVYIYLLPVMLVASTSLFIKEKNKWRLLLWISYLYLPCLLVALYQVYVDSTFLNNRPSVDFVGGLAISFISFRILLFLFLPLYVFALLVARTWWGKILFLLPIIATLWLARLSYGRASIFGILIFILFIPIVRIWVDGAYNKVRNYVVAGSTALAGVLILAGIMIPTFHSVTSQILPETLVKSTYSLIMGKKDVDPRQEMQIQAFKLIEEAPIAGWGPSGFMKNVDRVRFVGGYESGVTQPMTSLYLGMLVNYGVIGLFVIVLLCVMPLLMVYRVRKKIQNREERLAVGISFSVVCIMLLLFNTNPNIDYQDVLWVYVVYIGFLISVSLQYTRPVSLIRNKPIVLCGIVLVCSLIIGTYRTTYGTVGYKKIQNDLVSFILDGYQPEEQQILFDTEKLTQIKKISSNLIATRGNPFRMKYTTNVLHMVASSDPYHMKAGSDLVCIKTLVQQQGSRGSFILGLRVFVDKQQIEEHLFYTSGTKNLFYEISNDKGEITVEVDLRKSIPYHEDDRTEISLTNYNPNHADYGDLQIKVGAISYKKAQ